MEGMGREGSNRCLSRDPTCISSNCSTAALASCSQTICPPPPPSPSPPLGTPPRPTLYPVPALQGLDLRAATDPRGETIDPVTVLLAAPLPRAAYGSSVSSCSTSRKSTPPSRLAPPPPTVDARCSPPLEMTDAISRSSLLPEAAPFGLPRAPRGESGGRAREARDAGGRPDADVDGTPVAISWESCSRCDICIQLAHRSMPVLSSTSPTKSSRGTAPARSSSMRRPAALRAAWGSVMRFEEAVVLERWRREGGKGEGEREGVSNGVGLWMGAWMDGWTDGERG